MAGNPEFLDIPPNAEAEPQAGLPSGNDTPLPEAGSRPEITFMGNSYDMASVVGVTTGAVVLLSCATCNLGYYCLPFIPILLGIVGLVSAKDSVDPQRTKLLSWLSLGSGAVVLLLIFLFIVAYIGLLIFVFAADSGGF